MAQTSEWSELERLIADAEAGGGTVGVAIQSSTGHEFRHNASTRFRAASTVKIPIMIQICRRIEGGDLALDQEYAVRKEDHSFGSGVLHDMHAGLVVTIHDLLYLMMSISDNTATNILIDLAQMDAVNATMQELGMRDSTLGRKMQGRPAEAVQAENWATPNDYASALGKLLKHEVASPDSCDKMIAILEQQQNGRRIGRYMPIEGLRWGSKTGSVGDAVNDVGFAISEAGSSVISVFCQGLADMHVGEKLIGDIAREAIDVAGIADPLRTS